MSRPVVALLTATRMLILARPEYFGHALEKHGIELFQLPQDGSCKEQCDGFAEAIVNYKNSKRSVYVLIEALPIHFQPATRLFNELAARLIRTEKLPVARYCLSLGPQDYLTAIDPELHCEWTEVFFGMRTSGGLFEIAQNISDWFKSNERR